MSENLCPACGVKPSELHLGGCDVERCSRCGGQAISCECVYEVNGIDPMLLEDTDPDMFEHGATDEMTEKLDREWPRMPWSGEWPGVADCRRLGWFCKEGDDYRFRTCSPDEPGATEDLNRLSLQGRWDRQAKRFEYP